MPQFFPGHWAIELSWLFAIISLALSLNGAVVLPNVLALQLARALVLFRRELVQRIDKLVFASPAMTFHIVADKMLTLSVSAAEW
jgi:hypothetical protein